MNQRIQFEQWVPVPLERVFLFFANPRNLPRIMPPETRTELIRLKLVSPPRLAEEDASNTHRTTLAGVGSEIVTSFRVIPFLPLRSQWITLITEFEWNHHFADIQEQGPFKSFHHRHELTVEVRGQATGTIVRDVINYDLGFEWLGTVAQKLFIRRLLQQTFEYRQRALEKLLR